MMFSDVLRCSLFQPEHEQAMNSIFKLISIPGSVTYFIKENACMAYYIPIFIA